MYIHVLRTFADFIDFSRQTLYILMMKVTLTKQRLRHMMGLVIRDLWRKETGRLVTHHPM